MQSELIQCLDALSLQVGAKSLQNHRPVTVQECFIVYLTQLAI